MSKSIRIRLSRPRISVYSNNSVSSSCIYVYIYTSVSSACIYVYSFESVWFECIAVYSYKLVKSACIYVYSYVCLVRAYYSLFMSDSSVNSYSRWDVFSSRSSTKVGSIRHDAQDQMPIMSLSSSRKHSGCTHAWHR